MENTASTDGNETIASMEGMDLGTLYRMYREHVEINRTEILRVTLHSDSRDFLDEGDDWAISPDAFKRELGGMPDELRQEFIKTIMTGHKGGAAVTPYE